MAQATAGGAAAKHAELVLPAPKEPESFHVDEQAVAALRQGLLLSLAMPDASGRTVHEKAVRAIYLADAKMGSLKCFAHHERPLEPDAKASLECEIPLNFLSDLYVGRSHAFWQQVPTSVAERACTLTTTRGQTCHFLAATPLDRQRLVDGIGTIVTRKRPMVSADCQPPPAAAGA